MLEKRIHKSNDDVDDNPFSARTHAANAVADAMPRVGSAPSLWPVMGGLLGAAALGTFVFTQLNGQRATADARRLTDKAEQAEALSLADVPPAPDISNYTPQPIAMPEPQQPVLLPPPVDVPPPSGPNPADVERYRAPALIIDLSEYRAAPAGVPGAAGSGVSAGAVVAAVGGGDGAGRMSADEQFASKLGVGGTNAASVATAQIDAANTIVEGSVIPAVLESALNSDLPGYARAVVSRDVRGFDGMRVLVPRGSRLIGQYRSGVALGQSRAFVVWTRLIRPDGAAVELGAPATDALGRGGVEGDVDRHFLQRFGGAILLSLLNIGASAVTDSSDTSVVIATTRAGTDAAGVALTGAQNIAPTVKVPQGTPVRVFVSKDLDFSLVGPAQTAAVTVP
jgi:type IV secretion system protein VirB10